ncbi:hypothetical protein KCW65_21630, partial [Mycobacterium tuberculosis]|nr:hypothetical protein [Mycobacterium tuberculosis]
MDFVQLLELFGSGVWGTVKLFTVALVGSLVPAKLLAAAPIRPSAPPRGAAPANAKARPAPPRASVRHPR